MAYKVSEIKKMSFDCFHTTGEYMDHWKLDFSELDKFFGECEYMFGQQWEPIYLNIWSPNDSLLCHLVNMFYKHNYIVCFTGEMSRDLKGNLEGHSTLLDYAQKSNYRKKCEKNKLKRLKEKELLK